MNDLHGIFGMPMNIMHDIFIKSEEIAKRYGLDHDYQAETNSAGFKPVVQAMMVQALVLALKVLTD